MTCYRLEILVKPRPGLLDPQGKAVSHALSSLGYGGVADVRVGKVMDVEVETSSEGEALRLGEEMCRKILANPVTEDFDVAVTGVVDAAEAG